MGWAVIWMNGMKARWVGCCRVKWEELEELEKGRRDGGIEAEEERGSKKRLESKRMVGFT